jgi:hypothetical protein
MKPLKLFVTLSTNYNASYDEFVGFWKSQYKFPDMNLYTENIGVAELDNRNLYDLFSWKNGMNLSGKKQISVNKLFQKLDVINQLRSRFDEDLFEQNFRNVTPIWKIFLRHILCPEDHPIFDKHVYRAFRYLQHQDIDELPANKFKEELYFQEYIPFYLDMREHCKQYSSKEIDEALWAFGKFLSRYPKMVL